MDQTSLEDPTYHAAVVDLLGVLAYGELTAFIRMAVDSDAAPTLALKSALAGLANTEYVQYSLLVDHMTARGIDAEAAMAPFLVPFSAYHERTRPKGWVEGLVKAYVGDGIALDFYREISAYVDPSTQALVHDAMQDVGQAEFVVKVVREAIKADERVAGRLALWGRRLVGEALSQAQQVAVERDALSSLLVGGVGGTHRPSADLAELGRMFARLTDEHTRRMGRLGLAA